MTHRLFRAALALALSGTLAITAVDAATKAGAKKPAAPEKQQDDAAKPGDTAAGFTEALAAAKEQNKPALVVAYPGNNAAVARRVEAVLKEPEVAAACREVVLCVLDTAKASAEDAKALADFRAAHKLRQTPVAVLMIDPEQKLLSSYLSSPTAGVLLARLRSVAAKAPSYDGAWIEDYEAAAKLAQQLRRPMLLDFTGSDWCPWCHKLDQEVFATPEFQKFARDHVVLVKVDFPRSKPQPPQIKQQNQQLQGKYRVRGFPTVVVVDATGKSLGQLGYQPGGPGPWLQQLSQYTR